MRILLLTRLFSVDPNDGTMINDLALELHRQGHDVRVLCLEWKGRKTTGDYEVNGIPVWWYSQIAPGWLPKILGTPYGMLNCSKGALHRFSAQLDAFKPDLLVAFSFAFPYAGLLTWIKRRFTPRLLLVLWDFFPYHHFHIRGITNPILIRLAAMLENRSLQLFDFIGLMTPRNLDYFRKAYPRADHPELRIVPICGPPAEPEASDKNPLREEFNLPKDKVIAVFGGTLSAGRGIQGILDLARECSESVPSAFFVIIGDGPLKSRIESAIAKSSQTNILFLNRLERKEYQRFISACDIGLVSTVSDLPMIAPFPSKSIDYFRNHLAILASVEQTTDFSEILENVMEGGLASESGDLQAFLANLKQLVENTDLRQAMAENGARYFDKNLTASKVSKQIVELLSAD